VGASGAVCGIIFAGIAIFPGMQIGLFLLPISIPAWIFGLGFVLYSIFGIRSRINNAGHDAHLAGALVGMIIAICMVPGSFEQNLLAILAVTVPALAFIIIIATRPHVLLTNENIFNKKEIKYHSIDHRYNAEKAELQREVDRIL
jgi:peptidoglycan/LPS O-acetylase OafA/YrhL